MPIIVLILFIIVLFSIAPSTMPQPRTFHSDITFALDVFHAAILSPIWFSLRFVYRGTLRYFDISEIPTGGIATILGAGVLIAMLVVAALIQGALAASWSRYETRRYAKKKGRTVVDLDGNTYERWP